MSSTAGSAGSDGAGSLVPVICGPTAAGKSAIAMWLAARRDVAVVSADSRQVYRGFDIGTGKASAADRQRVPHHGVDVADPTERYSAAEWATMARAAIAAARAQGKVPLVVGGTGFYISALIRPLWEEPDLPAERRRTVQVALGALDTGELRRWCAALDPPRAHLGRAQLLRALEVALLTGERLSDLQRAGARPTTFQPRYLLVDPGLELPARIAARAAAMFDAGWVHEVRRLMASVPESAPAWNACGYRTVRQCAAGEIDATAARERVIIETRQYAKRQRTWFRHQLDQGRVQRLATTAPGWETVVEAWLDPVGTGRL